MHHQGNYLAATSPWGLHPPLPASTHLCSSQRIDKGGLEGWLKEERCILGVVGGLKEEQCILGVVGRLEEEEQCIWEL